MANAPTKAQQLAALQQQLTQATSRVQGGMTQQGQRNLWGDSAGGGADVAAGTADMNRINAQIAALNGGGAAGGGTGGMPSAADAGNELFSEGRQRVQDLTNDPVDAMVRSRLQDVMSGKVGPYDEATKNAMFTSQADQAGAGEAARNQSLMNQVAMNGGSMNDPSARSAMNESMLQRQLANQGAHLNVDMNANQANFDASQQAAGQLATNNQAHQAGITQASQYLGNQLGKVTNQVPYQIPNFSQFQSGFSSTTPSPAPSSFSYNPQPITNNASGGITNTLKSPDGPAPVWGTGYYAKNYYNPDGSSQTYADWKADQLKPGDPNMLYDGAKLPQGMAAKPKAPQSEDGWY